MLLKGKAPFSMEEIDELIWNRASTSYSVKARFSEIIIGHHLDILKDKIWETTWAKEISKKPTSSSNN
jgi:hypothetical protein